MRSTPFPFRGSLPAIAGLLCLAGAPAGLQANRGVPVIGGPYDPPGSLWDNRQDNRSSGGLASQDSAGNSTARTADDFVLDATDCDSGRFRIDAFRVQMRQDRSAPQDFGLDLFTDGGTGVSPTAGITPMTSFVETARELISQSEELARYELRFETPGLELDGGVVYWLSPYGADPAANASDQVENTFLPSDGASGEPANAVFIAPDSGTPTWEPAVDQGPSASGHYSFAVDGACAGSVSAEEIPTLGTFGRWACVALLAMLGAAVLRRSA